MNEFQIYQFKDAFPVRITDRESNPWFVAADVCKALEIVNPRKAVDRLDDDEVTTVTFSDGGKTGKIIPHKINIISESGLYALIIRSSKPAAKDFRKWITSEVLPSIRKTGKYSVVPDDPGRRNPAGLNNNASIPEMIEALNRRIINGERVPPAILNYAFSIARISTGSWYQETLAVRRATHFSKDDDYNQIETLTCGELEPDEIKFACIVKRTCRKNRNGATVKQISRLSGHSGLNAAQRIRIIGILCDTGIIQANGIPGEAGTVYRLPK